MASIDEGLEPPQNLRPYCDHRLHRLYWRPESVARLSMMLAAVTCLFKSAYVFRGSNDEIHSL